MRQPNVSIRLHVGEAPDRGDATAVSFSLLWEGAQPSGQVLVRCASLEELERVVHSLKKDLDGALVQAKEAVEKMRAREEQDKEKSMSPSDIWRQMEQAPTEEAMFACFNALSESKRLEVAEWVLTHVSMFKGRGPVFAEHYNIVSHTLDV
uniref:Uncharacterized protein n=1 Tax=Desulfacinum infernum TaxID=35837 RepID=A0A832A1C4_9BACT